MNQSTAIKQSLETPTSGQSNNSIISLSNVRMHQRAVRRHRNNMIKQRFMGLGLFLISFIVWVMASDPTVSIIFAMFYLPMMFSKKYIMNFNETRAERR